MQDGLYHPMIAMVGCRHLVTGGEIDIMAPGAVVRGTAEILGPVPSLGEHDALIRAEFSKDSET